MSYTRIYKMLCSVSCYHHYFLDDGTTPFDDSEALQKQQLKKHSIAEYLTIIPTKHTADFLARNRILLRPHPYGFHLVVKAKETAPDSGIFEPLIPLFSEEPLTFFLQVHDPLFENYSTVAAVPQVPFLFSNTKPPSAGGSFRYINTEQTAYPITDYTISNTAFFESYDAPPEFLPPGMWGMIHLKMLGDDTTGVDGQARNLLTPLHTLRDPAPQFEIRIANRHTIWNYKSAEDQRLLHSSHPTTLPLVKHGIVGYNFDGEEQPAASPNRLHFEKDGSGNIIKTISEIYIN